jgi:hypothetical protein
MISKWLKKILAKLGFMDQATWARVWQEHSNAMGDADTIWDPKKGDKITIRSRPGDDLPW